jgi:hypothetical protein
MKFIFPKPPISDDDERQAVDDLASTLRNHGYAGNPRLPDELRNALLVRTNAEIDRLSSGRALSVSWAARVAIPGVVAIISFFTALHYYGTPAPGTSNGVAPLIAGLPEAQLDSLMEVEGIGDSSVVFAAAGSGLFDIPSDVAADYLLETDRTAVVLEALTDTQVEEVLATLGTSSPLSN